MHRDLRVHLRWLTALATVPACGDDGATATTATTSGSESSGDVSDSDTITTITTADSSGSTGSSGGPADTTAGPTTSVDSSSSGSDGSSSTDASSSGSTGALAECGNDVIEGRELCDGTDLGEATCESVGFGPGELACDVDCGSYDPANCTALPECGNSVIEGGEACDDIDLGGETCLSQGFDAGELTCAGDCTFELGACVNFSCGDGAINGRETCDGVLLGGATCASEGFDSGTISCADNCVLDVTNCCGDGVIGTDEVCDGNALGGASCLTEGFDAGTLTCGDSCETFDTSACTLCGDGVAAGAEACDGADLLGNDCTTVPGGFIAGALACDASCGLDTTGCNFCGNDLVDAGEDCDGASLGASSCLDLGHTGGVIGCAPSCVYDESECSDFPLPQGADLVISEIMQNPTAIDDTNGEWFEIYNPSLVETFELRGCTVEGGGMGESFAIDTDLQINAGQYLTLATAEMPGFTPDFVWPGAFALVNSSDTVRLVCDGVTVDEVIYDDGATFPDPAGASMQLEPTTTDAIANDDGSNWCTSLVPFGPGDFGTPGAENTSCLPPDFTIDFCRLQFPTSILDLEGSPVDVYGRVFVAGLTDLSGVNDPAVNVQMQVGYGGDGTDPALDAGWTWTSAAANAAYGPASPGYEANNDEYVGTMTLPTPGDYDFAVRFTGDGGTSYTYCDGNNAGSSDGYAAADAGQLTSVLAGSPSVLYFSEYYEGTGLNKGLEIYNPSTDAVNLAGCSVRIYFNGQAMPSNVINLAGMVDADDVFVLCHSSFVQPFCDQNTGLVNFSGDDAIDLVCGGPTIDTFGQIGVDPGTEWSGGVPVVGTIDEDVRRLCSVTQGDSDGGNAFDPSLEWSSLPIIVANPQPENIGDLGQYVCP